MTHGNFVFQSSYRFYLAMIIDHSIVYKTGDEPIFKPIANMAVFTCIS